MPMTRIDRAIEYGKALIDPPTPYGFWRGGWPPPRQPQNPEWMYVETGNPPNPKNQVPNTNCAGLINLMAAAGGSDFRGGTLLYGQRIKNKRDYRPGMRLRRGEVLVSAFGAGDEGHIVMVLEDGTDPLTIGSDHSDGGTAPGVNMRYRAQRAHQMFDFEWVGEVPGLELGPVSDGPEERQAERERPERERRERRREPERRPEREVTLVTAEQLSEISGNPDLATLERYRKALVPEMQKAGITTHLRAAAFLANVVQETDRLRTLEEYGDERYFRSFLGDQWRYHGRGFLMNTWRDAYARLSDVLGEDLVSNPDLLTRPELAAKAATWFWNRNECSPYADRGEFKKVCAIINTGSPNGEPNGMADRLYFYDRAKSVLSTSMRGRVASRNGYNYDGLPLINLAAAGQADETMAFILAAEIRNAGIGVTVTNGRENVYALAKKIRNEPLGYRQLWIMGDPALEACGEYAELANWPISPKTDYYNLAGRDFTDTCRRAAKLADEKAEEGIGRRFLEAIENMAESTPTRSPRRAPAPPQDEEQEDGREGEEEYRPRRRREEREEGRAERDQYPSEQETRRRRDDEGRKDGRDDEPDGPASVVGFTDEEFEEIGREMVRVFSRLRQSRTPRGESEAYGEKEEA
jgi:predicted chitinase